LKAYLLTTMGNAQSAQKTSTKGKKDPSMVVKPPPDWNHQSEDQKYVLVSPQSDISNPSQFRHVSRKPGKTPISHRKRTSKVISQDVPHQPHHTITSLPAPRSFYFDRSSEDDECLPGMDSEVAPKTKGLPQKMKAKATRAKHLLKGCWKDKKDRFEGCVRETKEVEHKRFMSMSPTKQRKSMDQRKSLNVPPVDHVDAVQFHPSGQGGVIPEESGTISPRQMYLHDEECYIDRMVDKNNMTELRESPMMEKKTGKPTYPFDESKEDHGQTPVVKLFQGRRGLSDTHVVLKETNVQPPARHSYPDRLQNKRQELGMKNEEVAKPKESTNKRTSIEEQLQKQVDEQIRHQFKSKEKEIGRVKQLRESYLHKLEQTSRLSAELAERRQSTNTENLPVYPRELYDDENQPITSASMEVEDVPMDEPKPISQNRVSFATAPVVYSLPVVAQMKTKRMSAPLPKARATEKLESLPVLLKIAGWENGIDKSEQVKPERETELPALLQLAGWHGNPKKSTQVDPGPQKLLKQADLSGLSRYKQADVEVKKPKKMVSIERCVTQDSEETQEQTKIPMPAELTKSVAEPGRYMPGASMTQMLIDAYPTAAFHSAQKKKQSFPASMLTDDPSVSMDSAATPFGEVSSPLLTQDALQNAAFLFSPSYVDYDPKLLKDSHVKNDTTTTITTLDSRSRLIPNVSTAPYLALPKSESYPPPRPSPELASRVSATSDRRVRFSGRNQVFLRSAEKKTEDNDYGPIPTQNHIVIPPIESKMSDLTDILYTARESIVSLTHTMDTLGEDEDSPKSHQTAPTVINRPVSPEEESSPPTHWSYSTDFDNGVTPLRSGKGTSNASNTTNSPFKRFKEAKNRFASKKIQPVKRSSPVKSRPVSGLVHARIAAMEQKSKQPTGNPPKTRRDTIGHKVIAPRKATLKSPHFRRAAHAESSESENKPTLSDEKTASNNVLSGASDMHMNAQYKRPAARSMSTGESGYQGDSPMSTGTDLVSEIGSEVDDFAMIRNSNNQEDGDSLDEEDARDIVRDVIKAKNSISIASNIRASTEYEADEDDFAAILQYQTSMDDESFEEETVTTVRHSAERRSSVGSGTVFSVATSATVIRQEHSQAMQAISVVSGPPYSRSRAVGSYPPTGRLTFREEALVKPSEQSHRAPPGALILSPMQRTPMQARKWRALAAAHQQKNVRAPVAGKQAKLPPPRRKSLSERSPNVVGY
jgi:hypothetical protein